MKDWFPLTSYDFYAMLTAGMVTLAAYDRVFMGSALAHETHWNLVSGVFWGAIAYLIGQIVAIPSAAILEHAIARRLLRSPTPLLLGLLPQRSREKFVLIMFAAREYQPFPKTNRDRIVAKLAKDLNVDSGSLESEAAFQLAFPRARDVADTAARLDNFLNLYGMCRNVSFAALIAAVMLAYQTIKFPTSLNWTLCAGALVLSIGLFGRFLKFYAAYAREIFRTYENVTD
jgi:hypothetical protein